LPSRYSPELLGALHWVSRQKKSQIELPKGSYTVSCRPYAGTDFTSLPVLVTGVTSGTRNGIQIDKVEVENKSTHVVDKLRFSWYLFAQESPDAILQQGQTKLLGIPGGIKPGEIVEILFPVINFAKAAKMWNTNNVALGGKFIIQVAVNEVTFDNGSARILLAHGQGKPHQLKFDNALYRPTSTPPSQPQFYCPNQSREVVTSDGVPVGFTCAGATGQSCTNAAGGQSCLSAICRRDGAGPIRPPIRPIEP
jgi:hypothetical protein